MPLDIPFKDLLDSLPVYQPGRPIEEVARELGMPAEEIIKLASNENPFGPSPRAMEALRRSLEKLHLYPDGNSFYLKGALAERLRMKPGNIVLGNGSNEVLELIGHALLEPGVEAVVSQYCFAVYPIVTHLFGAQLVTVPADELGHDLKAMRNAVTGRTRVVFVANPNNPTGTLIPNADLIAFIEDMPSNILVVVDEAYTEFLEEPPDLLPLIREQRVPNLVVTRTFSKIFGLAGLRIGYGVGHSELIAALEKTREPFNLNAAAQTAALAALDDDEHVDKTKSNNREELRKLESALESRGLEYVPSAGNFSLVRVGHGATVFRGLQKEGVIVRPMAGYGLPEWIRVTVGTPPENRRFLEALDRVLDN
ncbi:MAG: histidinol-phosphate transaminase [Verrucomicrobia bacterium]|nr:histidinol-phosphate transaminase [Verrucomicrobiota bacterium]